MTQRQRIDADTRTALAEAWHRDSAAASLERWLDLSAQEGFRMPPEHLPAMVRVFGASWYFTRFLFYRGTAALSLFEPQTPERFAHDVIGERLRPLADSPDRDAGLDKLRVVKNEIMLQILLADLRGSLDLAAVEGALTSLAEHTLHTALTLFIRHSRERFEGQLGVLGMGRMAGREMNFGSDLDLIFLHPGTSQDMFVQASALIRALLRGISTAAPAGILYEIDMRLRPHGSAGALITARQSFEEHHAGERDIWERQMMTRCRPVVDDGGLAGATLASVMASVYAEYDADFLRREIRGMRMRVEHELGRPAGRYELKRGPGGVMDIDFICHFLQLAHGHARPELRTATTRVVLPLLARLHLLPVAASERLLEAYDFLKQVESRLRVFDMKSISTFGREPAGVVPLARALRFAGSTDLAAAKAFLDHYRDVTAGVRDIFNEVLPEEA